MTWRSRFGFSLVSVVCAASVAQTAVAAPPFLFSTFVIHEFDTAIAEALGYGDGTVVYLRELASLTSDQAAMRKAYEARGCYPFNLMQNGLIVETGYNCQTFFCVGYIKGPKVCLDRKGNAYGGIVEITKRLETIDLDLKKKMFADFSASSQSAIMLDRIQDLLPVQCSPYYLMLFDVAVGEGFTCDEVGQYPYFSSANDCWNDWRTADPQACQVELRENEYELRLRAIEVHAGRSGTGELQTGTASLVITSPEPEEAPIPESFPDVLEGHYGYTAIMDLAKRGIVRGFEDGTFRPYETIDRAAFSKILIGGLHASKMQNDAACFEDVTSEWFSAYVCTAKRLGWIEGYPDGLFHAEQRITKAEAMKIIVMSLGVPLDSVAALPPGTKDGQWYSPYIRKAMELGLILESSFNPGMQATRADTAVWIYRSLKGQSQ